MNQKQTDTRDTTASRETTENKTFAERLGEYIASHRMLILGIAIGIALALAGVGIYSAVSENAAAASSRAMESVETKLEEWSKETDETKKADLEKTILADIEALSKRWPRSIAAQRALLRKAGILSQKKEWPDAEQAALDAFGRNKSSYAAPVALSLAAVAAEESGNIDAAIGHYETLAKDYIKDNPLAANALFNLGRLYESKGDYAKAKTTYEKLVAEIGTSEWALLAKNRLIFMVSAGLAK
ncbi:MAG: tetratricopeptide repeat protein [Rectinemataceae bacterium]